MPLEVVLRFVAPIPTGHRVQVIRAQRYGVSTIGGAPHWEEVPEPIVVDLDTSIIYCGDGLGASIDPSPLAFKAHSGLQVASITEGRVTSCVVSSDRTRETLYLTTFLVVEPTPQGYRQ